jgi:hypothetical protein
MTQVLVVVLNHNKKDMVLECLASLYRQAYGPCHIVVVDNASTDGSQSAIRQHYPNIDLICNDTNLGAAGGRNAGVTYARQGKYDFSYVLFLDDDAEVTDDSIRQLVSALDSDADAGIACGKTYINLNSDIIMSAGITEQLYLGRSYDRGSGEKDQGQFDKTEYVDACGGFAIMIRIALFEELGGFDDSFTPYGWEDVDLCLRARSRRQLTRYVPDAVFAHKGTRLGRGPNPDYERNKSKNFMKLLFRHTTVLQKISAAFFVPLRGLLLLTRFALKGHWRAIYAQLSGVSDFFRAR